MSSHRLARSASIDHTTAVTTIDGIEVPWYLTSDGPQVEKHPEVPIAILTLPIYVDGVITIKTADSGIRILDPELGPVGRFARELVRQSFIEAENYPWDLPPSIDDEE